MVGWVMLPPFLKDLPFPILRLLAAAATALFAALTLGGVAFIVMTPEISRWPALATVGGAVLAALSASVLVQARAMARHRFRIVSGHHAVSFRTAPATSSGGPKAEAKVRSEFLLESLRDGESKVRLQKFVIEPTGLDPADMLTSWQYACRVAGVGAVEPDPFVSSSRSLQIDVPLGGPLRAGERFTLVEELTFESDLESAARFVFQPSYPAGGQSIEFTFEGLRPFFPRYRVERPPGEPESGEVGAMHPNRFGFAWQSAEPGEQLILDWTWDPDSLPKPESEIERLMAEARTRQEEIKEKLATIFHEPGGEEMPAESAGDHWIIRAARMREAGYSGAPLPETDAATLPGESGFADGDQRQAADGIDTTPAEEHPIVKAAREREKSYKPD